MNRRSTTYRRLELLAIIAAATGILTTTLGANADTAKATPRPEATKSTESHSCGGGIDAKLDAEIESLPAGNNNQPAPQPPFKDDPTTNINDIGDVGGDFEE
jgi:hypothetical protein